MDAPLMPAISAAAIPTINDASLDAEEVSRGAYALAWAQGRMSLSDHARILVAGHAAQGRCNRLSFGLIILDEEWRRRGDHDGALAALEALAGKSMALKRTME